MSRHLLAGSYPQSATSHPLRRPQSALQSTLDPGLEQRRGEGTEGADPNLPHPDPNLCQKWDKVKRIWEEVRAWGFSPVVQTLSLTKEVMLHLEVSSHLCSTTVHTPHVHLKLSPPNCITPFRDGGTTLEKDRDQRLFSDKCIYAHTHTRHMHFWLACGAPLYMALVKDPALNLLPNPSTLQ